MLGPPAAAGQVILSTGSELVEVGQRPAFGEVIDSNSYMLAAAAKDAGADARRIGIVADDHAALLDVLENQLLRADILVTSGGVSMGAFDVVKQALSELGTVEFIQVAMQPGKPQGFGHLGEPGADLLPAGQPGQQPGVLRGVRPAGHPQAARQAQPAARDRAGDRARRRPRARPGIRQYRRGVLHREAGGGYSVSFVGGAGSHLIASLALVELPGRHRRGRHRGDGRSDGHGHAAAARRTAELGDG